MQLYCIRVYSRFSICFHGCDASVFVLLGFTVSYKVTVLGWGFTMQNGFIATIRFISGILRLFETPKKKSLLLLVYYYRHMKMKKHLEKRAQCLN